MFKNCPISLSQWSCGGITSLSTKRTTPTSLSKRGEVLVAARIVNTQQIADGQSYNYHDVYQAANTKVQRLHYARVSLTASLQVDSWLVAGQDERLSVNPNKQLGDKASGRTWWPPWWHATGPAITQPLRASFQSVYNCCTSRLLEVKLHVFVVCEFASAYTII